MFDIALPAGSLGLLANPITKFLFYKSYEISHQEYLRRNQIGQRFENIGKYFSFDIHLESDYISNATIPISSLVLRNISEKKFKRIELIVKAEADYAAFQDFTTLFDVDDKQLVINLPRIPLKQLDITKDHKIIRTYNKVQVKIRIIDDPSITQNDAESESLPIHPSYTEFLNSRWDKKWDAVWNLDFIESLKDDIHVKLRYYLITRNRYRVAGEPNTRIYNLYKFARRQISRPVYWLIGRDRVVTVIFWMPIFLRLKKLTPRSPNQE